MTGSRRAKTLIEMAIVISIMSVALMLSATTLVALFRLERQVRSSEAHRLAISRLASHWRADAHAAVAAQIDLGCRLTMPDGRTIHYAASVPEITREVRRGGEVLHRDAFVLALQSQAEFSLTGELPHQIVRLSISPTGSLKRRHQPAIQPTAIAAAVNLHQAASFEGGSP
jgi:type II secretory pathway component PulJ